MNPERHDPYGFHKMLVNLAKRYLPQSHSVLDFYRPYDRDAWDTRIVCNEFEPKCWEIPVSVTSSEMYIVSGKSAILGMLRFKFECAFQNLSRAINEDWNLQVIPADVPSGE